MKICSANIQYKLFVPKQFSLQYYCSDTCIQLVYHFAHQNIPIKMILTAPLSFRWAWRSFRWVNAFLCTFVFRQQFTLWLRSQSPSYKSLISHLNVCFNNLLGVAYFCNIFWRNKVIIAAISTLRLIQGPVTKAVQKNSLKISICIVMSGTVGWHLVNNLKHFKA